MNQSLKVVFRSAMIAASALLSACGMMTEDLSDCPDGLFVRFVYDYNTMRADMFKDHVGHISLYVYDENGRKVAEKTVSNTSGSSPLADYGYTIHFTPSELPAGRYRLQAVGMQRDWEETLGSAGAKYRKPDVSVAADLRVSLDHASSVMPGTQRYAVSNAAPLDTLWHTLKVIASDPIDGLEVPAIARTSKPYSVYPLEDQYVVVRKNAATYATLSLIRDTKHLNITLRQIDEPEAVAADGYEVRILDNNAHLDHDNEVITSDSLHYSPYASWTSRFLDDGSMEIESVSGGNPGQYGLPARADGDAPPAVVQRTAHYNIMFNRLMYDENDNANNAILQITNRATGAVVAHINLPSILSQGRDAYEIYNYGHQEYLDREYDYHLDFFLKGDKWLYCDIVVNVLSWAKRTQNVEL